MRERDPDVAVAAGGAILDATGYEEIGLTVLSAADYTYVNEVAAALRDQRPGRRLSRFRARASTPSMSS